MKNVAIAFLFVLIAVPPALAQTDGQLWGDFAFQWPRTHRFLYSLDLEPKVLVVVPPGDPSWWCMDVLPGASYVLKSWVDASGEMTVGYTRQTDDENSVEVTARGGLHFHLLSRDMRTVVTRRPLGLEHPPKRKVVLRDLIRVEERNFYYSSGKPTSSTWRFRNRFEFQYPLNRERISMDGTRYLTTDWEWFVPLGDPSERFSNRQRIRAGLGYRKNARFRFEALYMWSRSRDTTQESYTTTDHTIDLRFNWVHR
jgi:hypothetical protein